MTNISPIVKWVGGKTQLLNQLITLLPPEGISSYCEPFLGGGAMLFKLQPQIAFVNDMNIKLIRTYNTIKCFPEELINELSTYQNTSEFFYYIREQERDNLINNIIQQSARFIYLNKTCFNGLYRENKQEQFNVPYGYYKNPDFINANGIRNMSRYLNSANIYFTSVDFSQVINNLPTGTFVYLDPPYDPVSKSANFTSYTKYGFTINDQIRLKQCCDDMTIKGIKFMLSNSDTDFIRQLYSNYNITEVFAKRSINCNGNKRGNVTELIIRNY